MDKKLKEQVKKFPDKPGVYLMKSTRGKVLYVGKASSLRKRVLSYFRKDAVEAKKELLMEKVVKIDYIICQSQVQALLLEACLIKENKPKYNTVLKDGKSYPYVEVTREQYPRIFISRPKGETDSLLLGPYTQSYLIKQALSLIRQVFPYRSCRRMPKKPCLFHHLSLCPAPCAGLISAKDYQHYVSYIIKILTGDKKRLEKNLKSKMQQSAKEKQFEQAAYFRDKLYQVNNLYLKQGQEHVLKIAKDVLNLKRIPLTIEAIDISNLAGKLATGSVVVFKNGMPSKSDYRRYRIKTINSPNDYQMIREVIYRRYRRLKIESRKMPELIVIDGGRGHLKIAAQELKKLQIDIDIIAIAKAREQVWLINSKKPLIIAKDNPALKLIQHLRDESHRFAKKYHVLLRNKKFIE
jgi:excinuclease ABC subunit C